MTVARNKKKKKSNSVNACFVLDLNEKRRM